MYKTVIKLHANTPAEMLSKLAADAAKAFDNRAGFVPNSSKNPYELIFEGDDDCYPCLDLGTLELSKNRPFLNYVSSWDWIDDDPDESCSMLDVIARRPA